MVLPSLNRDTIKAMWLDTKPVEICAKHDSTGTLLTIACPSACVLAVHLKQEIVSANDGPTSRRPRRPRLFYTSQPHSLTTM